MARVQQRHAGSAPKRAANTQPDNSQGRGTAQPLLPQSQPQSYSKIVVRQGQLTSTISLHRGSIATGDSTHAAAGTDGSGRDAEASPSALEFKHTFKAPRVPLLGGNDGQATLRLSRRIKASAASVLQAFLPTDYKNSVTPEYIHYTKWQFVHNTLGSASGVLATQAMLYAMGLGAGALPLSAAINWVIKDGFGQLGGVAYATMVGQKFDSDPKHQRFWSTVWLQSATWLEMLTPLAPHMFLLIGSVANIGKNISWLAMSATKASINRTFCRKENLGDLTAKYGSQATAAGLLGTAAGILIGATMDVSIYTLLVGFIPISLTSVWANYKSLSYAITPTLNLERAQHMVGEAIAVSDGMLSFSPALLKSPRQASAVERFMQEVHCILPTGQLPGVVLSPPLSKLCDELPTHRNAAGSQAAIAQMVSDAFEQPNAQVKEKYYIGYLPQSTNLRSTNGNLYLWFNMHALSSDILLGFYHAIAFRQLLGAHAAAARAPVDIEELRSKSHEFARRTFDDFCSAATQSGWDIGTVYFAKRSRLVDIDPTQ
ncbi:DUF647-domain-containing protein [Martensiomyces pterosporus]|nr:DUF647-domain-containing protein [Martensiomyces pterosporus]